VKKLMMTCAVLSLLGLWAPPPPASAAELCVGGPQPGCHATIQAAVDAAQDGDTIRVGPGTFAGGITIEKSLDLIGAGAGATTIAGGGPVVTIGEPFGAAMPTVSISRVTITRGLNNSTPDPSVAAGGGVWIPPAAGNATGATVTISNSVITRNRVTAETPFPFCGHLCAFASGGGISNSGTLTVTSSRISDNVAGSTLADPSAASDADGGGITNHQPGTLTLKRSIVSDNRAAVSAPNGRFAESGGIDNDGVMTVEDSVVDGNSADVAAAVPSSFPFDVQQEAVGGGVGVSPGASATITRTSISRNTVSASNLSGDAQAISGGIDADGSLLLVDSRVDHNRVSATVPPSSGNLAGAVFAGLEVAGVVTIRNSSVSHNILHAVSATGAANVAGGGIGNLSGQLALERTLLIGNRATANGVGGLALGGGIVNVDFGGGPPELALSDSVVTANQLIASPGITPRGGGIFTADIFSGAPFAVTLTRTVVAGNKPDQCFGC
jgi:hypothetical protein